MIHLYDFIGRFPHANQLLISEEMTIRFYGLTREYLAFLNDIDYYDTILVSNFENNQKITACSFRIIEKPNKFLYFMIIYDDSIDHQFLYIKLFARLFCGVSQAIMNKSFFFFFSSDSKVEN